MVEKGEKAGEAEATTPLNPQPAEDIETCDENKVVCLGRGRLFWGLVGSIGTIGLIVLILVLYCILRGVLSGPQLRAHPAFTPGWFYDDNDLIHYRSNDKWSSQYYIEKIDEFLKPYNKSFNRNVHKLQDCSPYIPPQPDKVCDVHIDVQWNPCTPQANYNYFSQFSQGGGPCIFLYLQNTYDWTPKYYSAEDARNNSMPSHMPQYLKTAIVEATQNNNRVKLIWVTCDGEFPADKEHMQAIRLMPIKGFPSQYFPYNYNRYINGYLNPIVALHFENIKRGIVVNVICKAWAKNINKYNPELGYISTTFSVLVD